jgi:peptidoglycan/LPS O-acetylase OafA/YrhL
MTGMPTERMQRPSDSALTFRADIEGLRGLAVILVVIYHAFPDLRSGGFVGVDVFFVISGYLITQLVLSDLGAHRFNLIEFYQRRIRRIVPALLAMVIFSSGLAWLIMLPGEFTWFSRSLAWCAPFLANLFFATTGGYFARAADLSPLLHLWSLAVEEQFYVAWPLFLMAAARFNITHRAIAVVVIGSLTLSIWGGVSGHATFFYHPVSRAWELGVGGLLASMPRSAGAAWGRQAGSVVGLALILGGGYFWNTDQPVPGIWCALPVGGAALLIWARSGCVNQYLLAAAPMRFVGKISYPLYLWHWPLLSFTHIVLGHELNPAVTGLECVIAIAAAYATYRWIEVPIRGGKLGASAAPVLLLALACLTAAGIAGLQERLHGRLNGAGVLAWDYAARDWFFPNAKTVGKHSVFATVDNSGRPDRKTLFIGDSHMQQYWPRIEKVIRDNPNSARSAALYTQAGCPTLPGLNIQGRGHTCNELFDLATAQAVEADVDTVVFGAFWEKYFVGEYASNEPRTKTYSVDDATQHTLTLDSPRTETALRDFEALLSQLVNSGHRVYIVLSNPTSPAFEVRFPPALRLSPSSGIRPAFAPGTVVDARAYASFAAPVMARLRNIAARSGATALDPRSTLCEAFQCPSTDPDGLPRYIDSSHLRGTAAREHAGFLDPTLLGASLEQQKHESPGAEAKGRVAPSP